jgi:hypothetical protein
MEWLNLEGIGDKKKYIKVVYCLLRVFLGIFIMNSAGKFSGKIPVIICN